MHDIYLREYLKKHDTFMLLFLLFRKLRLRRLSSYFEVKKIQLEAQHDMFMHYTRT